VFDRFPKNLFESEESPSMLEAGSQPSNVVPYEGLKKTAATIRTMLTKKACSIKDTQC